MIDSSSKSRDLVSEGVDGGIVSGRGVSFNGDELRGIEGRSPSFDPDSGTGDDDRGRLPDGGGEWDGLGVR